MSSPGNEICNFGVRRLVCAVCGVVPVPEQKFVVPVPEQKFVVPVPEQKLFVPVPEQKFFVPVHRRVGTPLCPRVT
ncbi:MAG: hypothetical protein Q7U78_11785 [Gallionella sp.]|nr:hypothetical protein [Gallionella sp.]